MNSKTLEKYDRQIRLWGQHGQNKCSRSKICLVNADPLGVEVLKGLCLAGIGYFTIIDSQKVTVDDVGCSLIPISSLGRSRAEAAKQVLAELNEDVKGEAYNDMDHSAWAQFDLVIISGFIHTDNVERLSKIFWESGCPLLQCKSIGFYGSLRCQMREHLVIETHPDNTLTDFRIDRPFDSLKEYLDSINLETASIEDINSYPYIVIIYIYLKKWQSLNNYPDDRVPSKFSEKQQLKKMIDEARQDRMKKDSSVILENFTEATKSVNSCFMIKDSGKLGRLFGNPRIADTSLFWTIIRALREFYKETGRLPVSGSIPDMISSSEEYIKLQTIYTQKAKEDTDAVFELVKSSVPRHIAYKETKLICKNIQEIEVINTEPIYKDYALSQECGVDEEEEEFFVIDLCLKASDLFLSSYGRLPGWQDGQVESDIGNLKECCRKLVGKLTNRLKLLDQTLYEFCRVGGAQVHATSAFIGGCVAQEAIKLITNQYVPINDNVIYNAVTAKTKTSRSSRVVF